jgi:methylmalonyl-CoA mutase C-terminal domain/subunit
MEGLSAAGLEGVRVFVGGIIPDEDMDALKELGVSAIFGPGASTEAISETVLRELGGG